MKKTTPSLIWHFLLLLFGAACGSTAVIMVKASDEHPLLVAAYRLLVASILLLPLFIRDRRQYPGKFGWKQIGLITVPAAILAFHFMSWISGARMTSVAHATLIGNLTPVAMPFFVWALFNEKITRQELAGTLCTLAGLVILVSSHPNLSDNAFQGDLICFAAMLAFAGYLAFGRKNSGDLSLWLFMVPLYFIAGLVCLVCALPFVNPIKPYTPANLLYILGLAVIPTIGGHTILNYSMRYFRGQVVSVTNLTQPIFAGFLGYFFFHEVPGPRFYLAAVVIILGVLLVLFAKPGGEPNSK